MDDLIPEFITETNESLEELDVDLINLEQNPNDQDLLSKIFRLMHTIKGTCGFLGLPRLEMVAHKAENLLGRFRDGDLEVTPSSVTLILESLDRVRGLLSALEDTGSEPEGDDTELLEKLDAVFEGREIEVETHAAPEVEAVSEESEPVGDIEITEAKVEEEAESVMTEEALPAASEEVAEAPVKQNKETPHDNPPVVKESAVAAQSLRVNVEVLEGLMTMVSELVLTRNQLLQILRDQKESDFAAPLQRLNHVVSDLQEGVMKTRMQPIGNAWSKLPRIIRDISMELGKKIDLVMSGQDTELDRQVLELIKDPLTHMVRNSADHGIEMPAERLAAGKSEMGKVHLNAYHEGGHIIIEIKDDGKGLNTERIKEKILTNNLATREELEEMNPQQIYQYIFKAGFSTAEKVTAVSGRGVGMDVVRTNIEKIGGSIELRSKEGKGSTFQIKIPLTLAIVSALIVEVGGERFAIPQLTVKELVMISEKSENKIERIKGTPVYRLRDQLLPLVSLSDLMGLKSKLSSLKPDHVPSELMATEGDEVDSADLTKHKKVQLDSVEENKARYIVVTQIGSYLFGIIVDRVFDTEEIVVKPVASILKNIEIFSGNTILGDGSVIMILDPAGIAKATGKMDTSEGVGDEEEEKKVIGTTDTTSLLLFKAGSEAPKAVPLALVSRLENIDLDQIEHSNGKMLIQYRGQLMPLIPMDNSFREGETGQVPVLVFAEDSKVTGLIVDEIIDIVEEHIDVQVAGRGGVLGSAIISGKATDVIDVGHFLSQVDKDWFKNHDDEPFEAGNKSAGKKKVLLIDDSAFFRNMLVPLLEMAGYHVTAMESAVQALEMSEEGALFDVIVSDIEMPDMSGFEFAQRVRSDSAWQNIPLVALTSHATQQDVERGAEVGFKKYIAKFDRESLLNTLSQTLSEKEQML